MSPLMQTHVYGKWILAGEHAVLRGCPALVFPSFARSLELSFYAANESVSETLHADFGGELGREMSLIFWSVLEKALETVGHDRHEIKGRFHLVNTIPLGAGMGASAALCVALGKWFCWRNWVSEADLYEFSRGLENLFHGESSGVDIAVALSSQGLHFERNAKRYPVIPKWEPQWYLSYSGKRGVTSECVNKVKGLFEKKPRSAELIDKDMHDAVLMAEDSLSRNSEEEGFELLADAINKARSCFERWGLTNGETGTQMTRLLSHGAAAVKPTGSGDGGFILSLWRTPPPIEIAAELLFVGKSL